jgi:hypothetical protein
MPESVANLLGKVVNADPANATYRQTSLGNLSANTPNSQFVKLVDKWFGGGERPLARNEFGMTFTHAYADGALFGPIGPRAQDVDQGDLGDCYLMASLASVAAKNPQAIRDMIIDNGDDTYTIRFFNGGKAEYVTVDRFLPTNSSGKLVYALGGRSASLPALQAVYSPIWCALIEKAFVIASSSGWTGQDASNTYGSESFGSESDDAGIVAGDPLISLTQILGQEYAIFNNLSADVILLARSQIIDSADSYTLLSTHSNTTSSKLVGPHVYVIFDADELGLTLFNPQGGSNSVFRISWGEAVGNFDQWAAYV